MAKVHIALVGGQPSPVFCGIKYSMPDIVILVKSAESEKGASVIERVVKNRLLDKKQMAIGSILFDALDVEATKSQIPFLLSKHKDDDVEINIAGGPKMWTYYFLMFAKDMANVSFVNIDQNCVFYNYTKGQKGDIEFDMYEELLLHTDHKIKRYLYSDFGEEDIKDVHNIENLRGFGGYEFSGLVSDLQKKFAETYRIKDGDTLEKMVNMLPNKIISKKGVEYIQWVKSENQFEVHLVNRAGKEKDTIIASPYAFELLLNGGWFELRVAELINKCLGCEDIMLGCEFSDSNGAVLNEIDIIANLGKRLLFVECKTNLNKMTDIDKFTSSSRNYGGNGSRKLFITYDRLDDSERQKCDKNGVLYFCWKDSHDNLPPVKALEQFLLEKMNNSRM